LVYAIIPSLKRLFGIWSKAHQTAYTNADAQRAFNRLTQGSTLKTNFILTAHRVVIKLSEWLKIGDEMVVIAQKP
jgi:hypothetical protein